MNRRISLLLGLFLLASPALRAEEIENMEFTADTGNIASLQRGAGDFMNYCSGCHSLKYMRYARLASDLDLPEDLVKQNLIFGSAKIGDPVSSAMPATSEQWFGRSPPDLTLETEARGADWVYSYLMSFYLDSSRPNTGVNNLYLPGVAMPAVLGDLQGWQKAVMRTDHETDASGKPVAVEKFDHFELVQPGKMKPEEFKAFVTDLTNFLSYSADPSIGERRDLGLKVLGYLFVLLVLSYFLKKEFWRDVH